MNIDFEASVNAEASKVIEESLSKQIDKDINSNEQPINRQLYENSNSKSNTEIIESICEMHKENMNRKYRKRLPEDSSVRLQKIIEILLKGILQSTSNKDGNDLLKEIIQNKYISDAICAISK
ncbi:MAG: hypothetical protein MHMPM18_002224 [Marteilia pararefringens]